MTQFHFLFDSFQTRQSFQRGWIFQFSRRNLSSKEDASGTYGKTLNLPKTDLPTMMEGNSPELLQKKIRSAQKWHLFGKDQNINPQCKGGKKKMKTKRRSII